MLLCFGFDIVFFAIFLLSPAIRVRFFSFCIFIMMCKREFCVAWFYVLNVTPSDDTVLCLLNQLRSKNVKIDPHKKIWNQTNKRANEQTIRTRQLNNIAIIMIVLSIQILANATFQHLCANPRASPCNSMIIKQLLKLDHLFIYEKSLSL